MKKEVCAVLLTMACFACFNGVIASCFPHHTGKTAQIDEDGADAEEEDPDTMAYIHLPESTDGCWEVDTLYQDAENIYCLNYNLCGDDKMLFHNGNMLIHHSDFYIEENEEAPHIYTFRLNLKSQVVDFSKPEAPKLIKQFFQRKTRTDFFKFEEAKLGDAHVKFYLTIEFPKPTFKRKKAVHTFLNILLDESFEPLPKNFKHASASDDRTEEYRLRAKYYSKQYFDETDNEARMDLYTSEHITIETINDNYVTYNLSQSSYSGGAHGMFSEQYFSYDLVNNCKMDWNYLFKPECRNEVENIFFDVVAADKKFRRWENTHSRQELIDYFKIKEEDGSIVTVDGLKSPAVCEQGIVFSFQPYEITAYAAGSFQFVIPFQQVKIYMTERAKKTLDLK